MKHPGSERASERGRPAGLLALTLLILLAPASIAAQSDTAPAFATAIIPVVANVTGMGEAQWRTDIALRNDGRNDVEVIITMPTAPGEPFLSTTLAAGQTLAFPDIVRQTFGSAEVLSPLLVHTLADRSITVGATIYPVVDGKISSAEIVPVFYMTPPAGLSVLSGLRLSSEYRTNIGLVNLGDVPATFILALQRLEGRNLAVQNITVAPRSVLQAAMQNVFPLIRESEDTFMVMIESPGDNAYGYASVVRNSDNAAVFIPPLLVRYGT